MVTQEGKFRTSCQAKEEDYITLSIQHTDRRTHEALSYYREKMHLQRCSGIGQSLLTFIKLPGYLYLLTDIPSNISQNIGAWRLFMNPEGKLTGSRLGIAPILLFDPCSVLMWDM